MRREWLVTGAGGLLGRDVVSVLRERGESVVGLNRNDLDITRADEVSELVLRHQPQVVVNCAAWTDVDGAEAREDDAHAVNAVGAGNIAAACVRAGATLVQFSTDYVFGGIASLPYDEQDQPAPRTAYGRTKLAGEAAVLRASRTSSYLVRTAWLYGAHGPNFVATMMRLERERDTVEVVDDQRGQPTWTVDVARQVIALVRSGAAPGIYHATSSGHTTWCGLARAVFLMLGADENRVRPVTTADVPRPAPRPCYSVLGHRRWAEAGLEPIRPWRQALAQALPDMGAAATPERSARHSV